MTAIEWVSYAVGWVWSIPAGTVLWKFILRRFDRDYELPSWPAAVERDGLLQLVALGGLVIGIFLEPPVDLIAWATYYTVLAYVRIGVWSYQSWDALGTDLGSRLRWMTTGTALFAPVTLPMLWAAGELTPTGYPPDSEVGRYRAELRAAEERWMARFMPEPVEPRPPAVDPASLPAIPEAVEGWRLFQLQADAIRGLFLVGMHGQRWSGIEFTAVCHDRAPGPPVIETEESCVRHLANPSKDYWHHDPGCGIYSTKRPTFIPPGYFIARCLSYGVVAEHEHGYRAQHCRIEELFLITPEHVTRPFAVPGIEERYGIPVNVVYPDLVDQVFAQWRSPDGDR